MLATQLIDTQALWSVIWVSFLGAVGGTAAFSVAIGSATRFIDLRREGRALEAGVFVTLAGIAVLLCLGGAALGIYEIITK
jgi:hypothetical protein